ncbi:hypothetical protein LXL04_011145 [Taraxacum kok-saghyz]
MQGGRQAQSTCMAVSSIPRYYFYALPGLIGFLYTNDFEDTDIVNDRRHKETTSDAVSDNG